MVHHAHQHLASCRPLSAPHSTPPTRTLRQTLPSLGHPPLPRDSIHLASVYQRQSRCPLTGSRPHRLPQGRQTWPPSKLTFSPPLQAPTLSSSASRKSRMARGGHQKQFPQEPPRTQRRVTPHTKATQPLPCPSLSPLAASLPLSSSMKGAQEDAAKGRILEVQRWMPRRIGESSW